MIIDSPSIRDIPSLRALWSDSFGDSEEELDKFFSTAFSEKRCLAAKDGDELLASLYWFDCSLGERRLAYIYAVSTASAHRGKGICQRLMSMAHEHLRALGYSAAVLVPAEPSLYGFYERLGYTVCSYVKELVAISTAEDGEIGESLTPLTHSEYGELRQKYLPARGIIQDDVTLKMLSARAKLYCGDGFILAAEAEGGTLRCHELLGEADLNKLLLALGRSTGVFRVPTGFRQATCADSTESEPRPFAMSYALDGAPLGECYFGIALD